MSWISGSMTMRTAPQSASVETKAKSPVASAASICSAGSRNSGPRMRTGSKATRRTGRASLRPGRYSNTRARSGDMVSTSTTATLWQEATRLMRGSSASSTVSRPRDSSSSRSTSAIASTASNSRFSADDMLLNASPRSRNSSRDSMRTVAAKSRRAMRRVTAISVSSGRSCECSWRTATQAASNMPSSISAGKTICRVDRESVASGAGSQATTCRAGAAKERSRGSSKRRAWNSCPSDNRLTSWLMPALLPAHSGRRRTCSTRGSASAMSEAARTGPPLMKAISWAPSANSSASAQSATDVSSTRSTVPVGSRRTSHNPEAPDARTASTQRTLRPVCRVPN